MARWFYRILLFLALPAVFVRLWWRARREPEYALRKSERFGRVPDEITPGGIWFHTVSAGETIAAAPLILQIVDAFPDVPVVVTTMTPTGSEQVGRLLGDRVMHCYAPYDFPFAVKRFLDHVQPRMLVLMETELWPNMIGRSADRGVATFLVNARLSQRSAKGYGRVSSLTRPMLSRLQYIACQSQAHVERFVALGADPNRVSAMGSVKFDISLPEDFSTTSQALRNEWGLSDAPVWIAASTHPGEDEQVLAAFQVVREVLPDARLILVPRHPIRADEVNELVAAQGLRGVMQSSGSPSDRAYDVMVGDVMGTLVQLYGVADAAFVGGTLVDHGGHNPLEPAACGVPVLCGPSQFNFTQIMDELQQREGLVAVRDAAHLGGEVTRLLQDPVARRQVGDRARGVLDENRGTTERLAKMLRLRARVLLGE